MCSLATAKAPIRRAWKGQLPRIGAGDVALLPEQRLTKITSVAKALGDPIRLQMVYLLMQRDSICTCEFEQVLGLNQSAVSYHSRILLDSGLIKRDTYGPWSHYSVVESERDILEEIFARW